MYPKEFQETNRITHPTAVSAQGVAYDGSTYAYLADGNKLYKYNYATKTLLDTHSTVSDGTYGDHIGDLTYYDGKLYVTASNYPTTPRDTYVMIYDAGTMLFQSEIHLTDTPHAAGIDFDPTDNSFWVVEDNAKKITQYDTSFVKQAEMTATEPNFYNSSHGWNGIVKRDMTLYLNPHEKVYPSNVQSYHGSTMQLLGYLVRPPECSQGMCFGEDGEVMFALRHYTHEAQDGIITTRLVPDDHRSEMPGYVFSAGANVSGSSYTEYSAVKVTAYAKKGDLIRVDTSAVVKSSGGNLRAYMDVASSSSTPATVTSNGPTLRSNLTLSDGITLSTFKVFRADDSGMVTFSLWAKIGSGSGVVGDVALMAQVIGRAL